MSSLAYLLSRPRSCRIHDELESVVVRTYGGARTPLNHARVFSMSASERPRRCTLRSGHRFLLTSKVKTQDAILREESGCRDNGAEASGGVSSRCRAAPSNRLSESMSCNVMYWPRSRSKSTSRAQIAARHAIFSPVAAISSGRRSATTPTHNSRKLKSENLGDARPAADRCKLPRRFVQEGNRCFSL